MNQDHLNKTRTDRGFAHLPIVPSTYGRGREGVGVRAYESSNASGPHIWVCVVEPANLNQPDEGELVDATAHLSADSALQLADQLVELAGKHYQLGSAVRTESDILDEVNGIHAAITQLRHLLAHHFSSDDGEGV